MPVETWADVAAFADGAGVSVSAFLRRLVAEHDARAKRGRTLTDDATEHPAPTTRAILGALVGRQGDELQAAADVGATLADWREAVAMLPGLRETITRNWPHGRRE